MEWPALESDPDIFNSYFHSIGLETYWEFQEVFDMSSEIPCSALILAYRKKGEDNLFDGVEVESRYFIKQVKKLDAACGLLAGLHAIFNIEADLLPGSLLFDMKEWVLGKNPNEAAEWLVGNEGLKEVHKSFANEGQTKNDKRPRHHFIAVLPGLTVFDGGKESALKIGDGFCLEFFEIVRRAIDQEKIGADINIMALQNLVFL